MAGPLHIIPHPTSFKPSVKTLALIRYYADRMQCGSMPVITGFKTSDAKVVFQMVGNLVRAFVVGAAVAEQGYLTLFYSSTYGQYMIVDVKTATIYTLAETPLCVQCGVTSAAFVLSDGRSFIYTPSGGATQVATFTIPAPTDTTFAYSSVYSGVHSGVYYAVSATGLQLLVTYNAYYEFVEEEDTYKGSYTYSLTLNGDSYYGDIPSGAVLFASTHTTSTGWVDDDYLQKKYAWFNSSAIFFDAATDSTTSLGSFSHHIRPLVSADGSTYALIDRRTSGTDLSWWRDVDYTVSDTSDTVVSTSWGYSTIAREYIYLHLYGGTTTTLNLGDCASVILSGNGQYVSYQLGGRSFASATAYLFAFGDFFESTWTDDSGNTYSGHAVSYAYLRDRDVNHRPTYFVDVSTGTAYGSATAHVFAHNVGNTGTMYWVDSSHNMRQQAVGDSAPTTLWTLGSDVGVVTSSLESDYYSGIYILPGADAVQSYSASLYVAVSELGTGTVTQWGNDSTNWWSSYGPEGVDGNIAIYYT